jgi:hypothetical protein
LKDGTKERSILLQSATDDSETKNGLSVRFIKHQDGNAIFNLSFPEDIAPFVKNLFENGASLVTWLMTQNRVDKAVTKAHDPIAKKEQEEVFRKHSERILSKFDLFAASELTQRQAIRKTMEFFKEKGSDLTCYAIELMVNDRKRMRRKNEA